MVKSRNVHRPETRAVYASPINTIKSRQRDVDIQIHAEKAGILSVAHIKKTMKVMNSTSYQENMKVREVIPHIGPIPIVIPLRLFLDYINFPRIMLPRALRGSFVVERKCSNMPAVRTLR